MSINNTNKIIQASVVFAIDFKNSQICLGHRKQGLNQGIILGIGGKRDQGEDILQTAVREYYEEVGVVLQKSSLVEMGRINFIFNGKLKSNNMEVVVFTYEIEFNHNFNPKESAEIKPKIVSIQDINYDEMWDDYKYWLPLVLKGLRFKASFKYDSNFKVQSFRLSSI